VEKGEYYVHLAEKYKILCNYDLEEDLKLCTLSEKQISGEI